MINFPFKQKSRDKHFNSFIWCRGCFNPGCRRIVKCFPFLKNNLNFGRRSSPAVISWTGTCCHHQLSPPGCICVPPTFLNYQNKVQRLKNPNPTNGNMALQLPDATVVILSISCRFLSFKWRRPLGTATAPVHSYPCHPSVLRAWRCKAHTIRPCLLREEYNSGQGQRSRSGVLGTLWF